MKENDNALAHKHQKLREILTKLGRVVVAYSGGMDSTFLLKVAAETLPGNVLAATARSETLPEMDLIRAGQLAKAMGVQHLLVETDEIKLPEFVVNSPDRCYICKTYRFKQLLELARRQGIDVVVDGENKDDQSDYRPGRRAARELGVISPLSDAGMGKADIRSLSKAMSLPTWNLPASACLASRIPYHQRITTQKLKQIEASEAFIRKMGISSLVRVRHEGDTARVEVDVESFPKLTDRANREQIVVFLKQTGFKFVALDLEGYAMGSLNRSLSGPNSNQTTFRNKGESDDD